MSLLDSAKRWANFIELYGEPNEISTKEAEGSELNNIWSLCSLGNDVLVNGLSRGADVISYWKTPKSWNGDSGTLVFEMTLWVECPTCAEQYELDEDWDQDDCDECLGSGTLFIELEDCLEAKSDEDVYNLRQAG